MQGTITKEQTAGRWTLTAIVWGTKLRRLRLLECDLLERCERVYLPQQWVVWRRGHRVYFQLSGMCFPDLAEAGMIDALDGVSID
ncbi:MAG: hypothetical protein GY851_03480 [bacterium]|nr:hypothetical protein [bacterium]